MPFFLSSRCWGLHWSRSRLLGQCVPSCQPSRWVWPGSLELLVSCRGSGSPAEGLGPSWLCLWLVVTSRRRGAGLLVLPSTTGVVPR